MIRSQPAAAIRYRRSCINKHGTSDKRSDTRVTRKRYFRHSTKVSPLIITILLMYSELTIDKTTKIVWCYNKKVLMWWTFQVSVTITIWIRTYIMFLYGCLMSSIVSYSWNNNASSRRSSCLEALGSCCQFTAVFNNLSSVLTRNRLLNGVRIYLKRLSTCLIFFDTWNLSKKMILQII